MVINYYYIQVVNAMIDTKTTQSVDVFWALADYFRLRRAACLLWWYTDFGSF